MRQKLEKKRIIVFIDHANIFHNIEILNIRINYLKLKEILIRNHHLVGCFMYMSIFDNILPKKLKFLNYLRAQGFIVQQKPLIISPTGKKKQKGVDIFIYKDIVELAEEDTYDKAILVSGDSDFLDVVRKLKELKKEIEIWSFKKSISRALIDEAGQDNVHYIDNILDEIRF
ncbi:MAG: NYN domain-containing protein [Promethearchaeota archaeon]|nr:MAG: NYN domain-containing protein [Candidatus Lokiarchaeota archaeon]